MGLKSVIKNIFLSIVILFVGCYKIRDTNSKTLTSSNLEPKSAVGIQNYDFIVAFDWVGDFSNNDVRSNLLKTEYAKYIKDFYFTWNGAIQSVGKALVYKIELNGDQPGMYRGDKLLLINIDRKKGYILWMDQFEPLKLNTKEASYFIGGRESYKKSGNYYIYATQHDTLFKIFESGIMVTNSRNDECKRYKGDHLKLTVRDVDKNGYNDITFEGLEYNYCKGLNEEILDIPIDSTFTRIFYKTYYSGGNYKFVQQ